MSSLLMQSLCDLRSPRRESQRPLVQRFLSQAVWQADPPPLRAAEGFSGDSPVQRANGAALAAEARVVRDGAQALLRAVAAFAGAFGPVAPTGELAVLALTLLTLL